MIYDEEKILADVRSHLGDYRYNHSLCVAKSAKALAEKYGGEPEICYVAGLLHDILKEQNETDALEFFRENNIELTVLEQKAHKLWHAISGAAYVRKYYPELPDEVSLAIRYHTTGREGMTINEKILFTADFISDDRDYPGVDDMRHRAGVSLKDAMTEGLRFTIAELSENCVPIHPDTVSAYNYTLLVERN